VSIEIHRSPAGQELFRVPSPRVFDHTPPQDLSCQPMEQMSSRPGSKR
jgi:hypothetical protein